MNKVDIVGYLLKKGELQKEDVGVIEVKDTTSYVAVSRNKVNAVLRKLQNEKLKGKKSENGSCLLRPELKHCHCERSTSKLHRLQITNDLNT